MFFSPHFAVPNRCYVRKAIVFCLDLSASMRKHSGVSSSKGNTSTAGTFYDHDTESYKVLDGLVEGVDGDLVLNNGATAFCMRVLRIIISFQPKNI